MTTMGVFDELPHLDGRGEARMVDVGEKAATHRAAVAEATVRMAPETVRLLTEAAAEKGDALAVARIAGIAGAKRVADLIPLAHPINLTHAKIDLEPSPETGTVRIEARVETHGKTGVEMEALTAASTAALALYDMIKRHERGAFIERVQLLEKSGGRSGAWKRG